MSRDWLVYVDDIVECTRRVLEYTRGMTYEEFVADTRTCDAVRRNLEIIGEAASRFWKRSGSGTRAARSGQVLPAREPP